MQYVNTGPKSSWSTTAQCRSAPNVQVQSSTIGNSTLKTYSYTHKHRQPHIICMHNNNAFSPKATMVGSSGTHFFLSAFVFSTFFFLSSLYYGMQIFARLEWADHKYRWTFFFCCSYVCLLNIFGHLLAAMVVVTACVSTFFFLLRLQFAKWKDKNTSREKKFELSTVDQR